MIPELLEKVKPYKELIIHDDILREYYNKLKAEDRAFLLIGLTSGYYKIETILDDMLLLVRRSYLDVLTDNITGFTSVELNHQSYKKFFENKKYFISQDKFNIMYSITGWIVKNLPTNQPVESTELENITLSFMLLFIFDDKIEIPDNITTFLDAIGSENI